MGSGDKIMNTQEKVSGHIEFHEMPEIKVFVGGCVKRGVGSSFRRKAHAHVIGENKGFVCVRSWKRLRSANGKPSQLMIHEYAHILTGHGHDDVWRAKMKEVGGRINYWEKKSYFQKRKNKNK